jgi:hypothetical protein
MPCRSTNSLPRASGDSPGRHDDDGLGGAGRFASVRHENIDPQGGPIGTPDRGAGLNPNPPPSRPDHPHGLCPVTELEAIDGSARAAFLGHC